MMSKNTVVLAPDLTQGSLRFPYLATIVPEKASGPTLQTRPRRLCSAAENSGIQVDKQIKEKGHDRARKPAINFIGVFFDSFGVLTFPGGPITGGLTYARKGREQRHDHRPHHHSRHRNGAVWRALVGGR